MCYKSHIESNKYDSILQMKDKIKKATLTSKSQSWHLPNVVGEYAAVIKRLSLHALIVTLSSGKMYQYSLKKTEWKWGS